MKPRLHVILLLVVLLGLAASVSAAQAAGSDLYSSLWDKGVVVVLYGSQYGTGWWVDKYYIVTAAHVVNFQSNVKVTLIHGDYQAVGRVIALDSLHDVAVIRAEKAPSSQYIWSLSIGDPDKGEQIFVIGYPFELYKIVGDLNAMSDNPRIAEGIVSWYYPEKQLFEFQASTDSGNSGGPIVDASGNVVGLVSFALEGNAANMYYGTSVSAIKTVLARAGVSYRVGLSSAVSETTRQSYLVPALVGGLAALIVTIMVVPMVKKR